MTVTSTLCFIKYIFVKELNSNNGFDRGVIIFDNNIKAFEPCNIVKLALMMKELPENYILVFNVRDKLKLSLYIYLCMMAVINFKKVLSIKARPKNHFPGISKLPDLCESEFYFFQTDINKHLFIVYVSSLKIV